VNTTTSYTQPALIGGLVMGVLSALPFVSLGNFCCCLWVVSGGLVAAYVLQANNAAPITPSDGAMVGLLAGIVGAAVHLVLSVPIDLVMAPFERTMAQRILEMTGNAEMRDMVERYSQTGPAGGIALIIVKRIVGFVFMAFAGAIFSTVGGVIGSMVVRKADPVALDAPPR
jgi:hypothetical protein